jgi:hypothetical protein
MTRKLAQSDPPKSPRAPRAAVPPRVVDHDNPRAVDAFFATLDHPEKATLQAIRTAILTAAPGITEGIKWNTASFYCAGWFATLNIRAKSGVQIVLHHGAKVRADSTLGDTLADPSGLLKWLAKDRALIAFKGAEDFRARRAAFAAIIAQWVRQQQALAGSG